MSAMATATQLTTAATAVGPHIYWITSRAAGIAALILSSLSVCVGLAMGARLLRGRNLDLRVTHEALSLATLAAIAVHGLTLLGDGYIKMGLSDVSVPFVSGYKTLWTSTGIVSFWMFALLGLSYYARKQIGAARWRSLHRLTALAWILGVVHSLTEDSDAGQEWFLVMTLIVVVPAVALLALRWLTAPAEQPPARPGASASPADSQQHPGAVAGRPARLQAPARPTTTDRI
jgi:methionine sulfoxide reductase heme-binding subunit